MDSRYGVLLNFDAGAPTKRAHSQSGGASAPYTGSYDAPGQGRQGTYGNDDNSYGGGGGRPDQGYDQSQGGGYGQQQSGRYDEPQGGYGQQHSGGYGQQQGGGYGQQQQGGGFPPSTGTSYGGGGPGMQPDLSGAAQHATQHAGSSGDASMFSSALSQLGGGRPGMQGGGGSGGGYGDDIDEQSMVQHHQAMYGGGGGQGSAGAATSGAVGGAAAMQALKMFSGGGGSSGNTASGSSGGGQNQFIGMAMAQASKLFDQQSASGNVVSAAECDCGQGTCN